MKLSEIKPNPNNPRVIKDYQFEKLCKSIQEFPKMMELRPIIVDDNNTVLGGNMRLRALQKLGYKDIPDTWVKKASELTEEEKRRFVIADNVNAGEWDWDTLANEWDAEELEEWGVELNITETEKLSESTYKSVYYEPEQKPHVRLIDCIDFDKYNKKIEVIEQSNIDKEKKEVLKWFAYRFLKIDFENVANYYYYNASDEEKEIIERLRLVLIDNGENGFIEDELLRITKTIVDDE